MISNPPSDHNSNISLLRPQLPHKPRPVPQVPKLQQLLLVPQLPTLFATSTSGTLFQVSRKVGT